MKKLILLAVSAITLFSCNNADEDLQDSGKSVVVQFAPSCTRL